MNMIAGKVRSNSKRVNSNSHNGLTKPIALAIATILVTSSIHGLTASASFASPDLSSCGSSIENVSVDTTGDAAADRTVLTNLNTALNDTLLNQATRPNLACLVITFTVSGNNELSFKTNDNLISNLDISTSNTNNDAKVFLIGNGVKFSFGGIARNLFEWGVYTHNDLEVHDILFTGGNSVITEPQASGEGAAGAIYVDLQKSLTVYDSDFELNFADSHGGAIYAHATGDAGSVTVIRSTFSQNRADGDGGAIHAALGQVVIRDSVFMGNSARAGGAVYANNDLELSNSRFQGNFSLGGDGGAVYAADRAEIVDSSFIASNAGSGFHDGGAVRLNKDALIDSSTFNTNSARHGGAVLLSVGGEIRNSTFSANQSGQRGGAIAASGNTTLLFSTFRNNISFNNQGNSLYSASGWDSSTNTGQTTIIGNVLANSSGSHPQIFFAVENNQDLRWNVTTTSELANEPNNTQSTFAELELNSALSGSEPQVLDLLAASSPAVGFVPRSVATTFLGGNPVDQKDTPRSTLVVNAGAWQGLVVDPPASPNSLPFSIAELDPRRVLPNTLATAVGVGVKNVDEVLVDGIYAPIVSKSINRLTFKMPYGVTGLVDVIFRGAGHAQTLQKALNFGKTSVAGKHTLSGFKPNSTKLRKSMKQDIRDFVIANQAIASVSCKGFASVGERSRARALATARAKSVCDYIGSLTSDLSLELKKGTVTVKAGKSIRRVVLTLDR